MGNIEIRQQNGLPKRTQIFNDKRSYTSSKSNYRKSLTPRNQNKYTYSPIRYSNINTTKFDNVLTQRKANTSRLNTSRLQSNRLFQPANQQSIFEDNLQEVRLRQKVLRTSNLPRFNTQQQVEQACNSSGLSGRIVSNSRRNNIQRFKNKSNNKKQYRQRQDQNPLQNRQIIKKVRNFNDFLNQIKRKLKQDRQYSLNRKKSQQPYPRKSDNQTNNQKTYRKSSYRNETQKSEINQQDRYPRKLQNNKSSRRIQVALKLQNQKIQLQRYRKLVERELSKNHSIENISLCTKNTGQKVLTIQYESILPMHINSNQSSKPSLRQESSQKSIISKINEINFQKIKDKHRISSTLSQNLSNKIQEKRRNSDNLKRLKEEYQNTMRCMMELGKTIQTYEKQLQINDEQNNILILQQNPSDQSSVDLADRNFSRKQIQQNLQNKQVINFGMADFDDNYINQNKLKTKDNKIYKIEGLFQKLSILQQKCQQTDREIKQAINSSYSNSKVQQSSDFIENSSQK